MLIENARLSKLKTTFSLEDVVFCEGCHDMPSVSVSVPATHVLNQDCAVALAHI